MKSYFVQSKKIEDLILKTEVSNSSSLSPLTCLLVNSAGVLCVYQIRDYCISFKLTIDTVSAFCRRLL